MVTWAAMVIWAAMAAIWAAMETWAAMVSRWEAWAAATSAEAVPMSAWQRTRTFRRQTPRSTIFAESLTSCAVVVAVVVALVAAEALVVVLLLVAVLLPGVVLALVVVPLLGVVLLPGVVRALVVVPLLGVVWPRLAPASLAERKRQWRARPVRHRRRGAARHEVASAGLMVV